MRMIPRSVPYAQICKACGCDVKGELDNLVRARYIICHETLNSYSYEILKH